MAKVMAGVRQDSGYSLRQRLLFVAQHGQNRPVQLDQRLKKRLKGNLVETAQPSAAQGQTCQEFPYEPQLRFAALWGQAVKADDQTTVLLSALCQAGPVLSLAAGK